MFKKQTIQNNNQTICEEAKEELQIHNVQPEIFVKRSEEAESCDKVIPGWKLVREDGERVEVTLNTASPSIVALAESNGVDSRRLLQSIEYEVEPYTDIAAVNTAWDAPGGHMEFPHELANTATAINLPPQLINHALRRELYFLQHEEYRNYPLLRDARNAPVGAMVM